MKNEKHKVRTIKRERKKNEENIKKEIKLKEN